MNGLSSPRLESIGSLEERVIIGIGFLAVAVGTFVAYQTPATGYEVSIYTQTPLAYWVCLVIAFAIAITMLFSPGPNDAPAALAGLAFSTVLGLPLIRGYFYYGPADSLTHLGWMRDMVAGTLQPGGLIYPGLHTASLLVGKAGDLPLTISMLIVVYVAAITFVVGVPMAVTAMTDSRRIAGASVMVAILFLPIRHISLRYMEPMSISDTILLFPIGLYLFARYMSSRPPATRRPTGIGVTLAVYFLGVLLFHPMQSLFILVFLVPIVALQFVATRRWPESRIASHRSMFGQTAFLGTSFFLWSISRDRVQRAYSTVADQAIGLFTQSSGSEPAEIVQQRAGSLEAIGVSPLEIFLKLFLASAVFAAIVGLVTVLLTISQIRRDRNADTIGSPSGASPVDRLASSVALGDDQDTARTMLMYLSIGITALVPFSFVLLIAGDASDLFFRALGAIMAAVTVYGGVVLVRWGGFDRDISGVSLRRIAVGVCIVILLMQTTTVVFSSPHIYKPNRQVSEQIYTGHEVAFEQYDDEIPILGLRQAPWRYHHAIYGVETPGGQDVKYRWRNQRITPEQTAELSASFQGDRYLTITRALRLRETVAFREVRYSATSLAAIENQPDVGRIHTNGEFSMYYINGTATDTPQQSMRAREVRSVPAHTSVGQAEAPDRTYVSPDRQEGISVNINVLSPNRAGR